MMRVFVSDSETRTRHYPIPTSENLRMNLNLAKYLIWILLLVVCANADRQALNVGGRGFRRNSSTRGSRPGPLDPSVGRSRWSRPSDSDQVGAVRLLRLWTAQCSSGSRKHTDSPPFPSIPELSELQKEFLIWIVHLTFELQIDLR